MVEVDGVGDAELPATARLSRLTLPESVLSKRYATVLFPAFNVTVSARVAQLSQLAVASSETCPARAPLTYRDRVFADPVPLA